MKVFKYTNEHLESCVNLYIKVFNAPPWNDKWTSETATKLLTNFSNMPSFIGFIGIIENQIIAACFGYKKMWWNNEEYFIEEMFVDNEHQD